MGREVKRVRVGFEWPLKKIWDGFINPYYKECPKCSAGYSEAYGIVAKHMGGLMRDRLGQENKNVSTITEFLCGRAGRGFMGHDSLSTWAAIKKIGELAGLSSEWITCNHCKGSGIDPDCFEKHEAWEETEPPEGDWYQVWETTSEGSPISPPFETPEELAEWLEANNASSFASMTCSYDEWLDFIKGPGWAPSAILDKKGVHSGVCYNKKEGTE